MPQHSHKGDLSKAGRITRAREEFQLRRELGAIRRTGGFPKHPVHRRVRWFVSSVACAFLTNGAHWWRYDPTMGSRYWLPESRRRCRICRCTAGVPDFSGIDSSTEGKEG
jgi:hypothetical protein